MLAARGGTRVWLRQELTLVVASLLVVTAAIPKAWAAPQPFNFTSRPSGNVVAPPEPTPLPTPAPSPTPAAASGAVLGASTQTAAGAAGPAMAFGIAASVADIPADQLDSELSAIKALGVKWVRYDIEWDNIEPEPGQFEWEDYDRAVQAVQGHGLQSLAILDYTPAWARDGACSDTPMCGPANPADYAAFVAAAVARYGPMGVHTWEIWNEPNIPEFFAQGANPDEYVALLKAADVAIKQKQPGSTVLTAGLSPAGSGGGSLSPVDFVNGMYAAGAHGYFDALGDHPYTYPATAGTQPLDAWGQMTMIHGIMAAHGDAGKKIWITEYGAPTDGPDPTDFVSEALQAQQVAVAVRLATSYPWVGAFFWYTYEDPGTSTDTEENFFGLVRADGSAKPALGAFEAAIAGR